MNRAKLKAADYLYGYLAKISDPLQMAMVAYSLHEARHRGRNDAYSRLKSRRVTSESAY